MGKTCFGNFYLPKNVFEMFYIRYKSSSKDTQYREVHVCKESDSFLVLFEGILQGVQDLKIWNWSTFEQGFKCCLIVLSTSNDTLLLLLIKWNRQTHLKGIHSWYLQRSTMTTTKALYPHYIWEGSAKVTETNMFQVDNFCFVGMSCFPFVTKSFQRWWRSVGSMPSILFEKTSRFKVSARQRSFSLLQSLQKTSGGVFKRSC